MSEVLFTSDLHLGHFRAAKARGYETVEQHDAEVVGTLQRQCTKRTLLWVLGDVAMRPELLAMLDQVFGRKKLVRGNHDGYPAAEYLKHFEDIQGFVRYKEMWLSHCPIHPQEMLRAKINVHGHIHKAATTECIGFPYLNVNWDFHRRALTLGEVLAFRDQNAK